MKRVSIQDLEQLNFRIKLLSERIDKVENMNSRLLKTEKDTILTPRLIPGNEAASYLGISLSLLHELIKDNCIPFTRIRRKVLFDRKKLDEWIATNNNAI